MTKKNVAIRDHAQVELDIVNQYERRFLHRRQAGEAWQKMRIEAAAETGVNIRRIYVLCIALTLGHIISRSIQRQVFGR